MDIRLGEARRWQNGMIMFQNWAAAAVVVALSLSATLSRADVYPSRPVRIIVGFAAGSSVDLPARLLAQRFSETLGQGFVVENKGGAGGNLAAEAVARSPKDGYTLHLATNGLANARAMGASYDPIQDFAPIVAIATGPQMLVAHPSVGVDNLQQLIALAKAKPGRITYGGGSGFTMTGLGGVLLSNMADIKLLHVPYTGSAPALVDLLAGRIDLLFAPALAVMSHVEQGRLKAIATTSAVRASVAPDVPTMAESGLPGYDLSLWYGLMAPAGTPREVIDKLSRVANEALKSDDVIKPMRANGIDPVGGSPEDFARFIAREVEKMAKLAALVGVKK
jgi:tripartite-type tricarboxylate transporter receptor subunit TctC